MTLRIEMVSNSSGVGVDFAPAGVCINVTADSTEHDGNVYLSVNVTHEGIIADAFDEAGNNVGTIAGSFDGWHHRIVDDPQQKPLWEDDTLQFARLLDEIQAASNHDIDYAALEESMDLDRERIDELFERARNVFETWKGEH